MRAFSSSSSALLLDGVGSEDLGMIYCIEEVCEVYFYTRTKDACLSALHCLVWLSEAKKPIQAELPINSGAKLYHKLSLMWAMSYQSVLPVALITFPIRLLSNSRQSRRYI